MATPEDKKELLGISIDELRRLYDAVSSSFDNLRAKALALLVAEVAIVAFLFSEGENTFQSIKIVHALVFMAIGISCLVGSAVMFLWTIASVKDWEHPPESKDMRELYKNFDNSPVKLLETLKNDYIRVIPDCTKVLSKRSKKFTSGVYLLLIGIFIILMLKYGGGTLNIVIS